MFQFQERFLDQVVRKDGACKRQQQVHRPGGKPVPAPGIQKGFLPEIQGVAQGSKPGHRPQVVNMLQNFMVLTEDPEGQAAYASTRISEQTQGLLDAVWDQLTRIRGD